MVNIPQGGTIRNRIEWTSYYSGGGTWYLHTFYGQVVASEFNIYWNDSIAFINHPEMNHISNINITVDIDAPAGIYDAWTVMSTENNPGLVGTHDDILADKYDAGVLRIVPLLLATIDSTEFSQVI